MQEMWVWSLGQEDPLKEEIATLLKYSCLGNSQDRGAWWATVHGVNASRERGSRVFRVRVRVWMESMCVCMCICVCVWFVYVNVYLCAFVYQRRQWLQNYNENFYLCVFCEKPLCSVHMKNHLHFSVNTLSVSFSKKVGPLNENRCWKTGQDPLSRISHVPTLLHSTKLSKTLLEPADIFSLYPLGEVIILSSASHCRKLRNLIFVPHSPLANPVEGKGPPSFRGLAWAGLRSQGLALREWEWSAGQAAGQCAWAQPLFTVPGPCHDPSCGTLLLTD